MVILDFIVKCFFVFLRKRGEDGLYASFIPVCFTLSWLFSLIFCAVFSFLFENKFGFFIGSGIWILTFVTIYIFIIKRLNRIYILNKRELFFAKMNFYYYVLAPVIFFSSFVFIIISIMILGHFSNTVIPVPK